MALILDPDHEIFKDAQECQKEWTDSDDDAGDNETAKEDSVADDVIKTKCHPPKKTPPTTRHYTPAEKAAADAKKAKLAHKRAARKALRLAEQQQRDSKNAKGKKADITELGDKLSDTRRKRKTKRAVTKEKKSADVKPRKSGSVVKSLRKKGKKKAAQSAFRKALGEVKDESLSGPELQSSPVPSNGIPAPLTDLALAPQQDLTSASSPVGTELRDWRRTDLEPLFQPVAADVLLSLQISNPKIADALAPAPSACPQVTYDAQELAGLWEGRFSAAKLHAASENVRRAALIWYWNVQELYPELFAEYQSLARFVRLTGEAEEYVTALALLTAPNMELNAIEAARALRTKETDSPNGDDIDFNMLVANKKGVGEDEDEDEDHHSMWLADLPPDSPLSEPMPLSPRRASLAPSNEWVNDCRLSVDWTLDKPDSSPFDAFSWLTEDKGAANRIADVFLVQPCWIGEQSL
ncbi:hypothetical protein HDU86_006234 [Geranomyces michiganensis]|nr:hypothetical protein HDU86_006234 [Geranomyces michiganensis]